MKRMTQKVLKEIGYSLLEEHGAEAKIRFKHIQRGRSTDKGNISLPIWSIGWGQAFSIYYVVHEVCHSILFKRGSGFKHGEAFKTLETKLLERFDIIPTYSKAYAKKLTNKAGKILYQRT